MFLLHFNDEHHHTVTMTIASLTPMLSWLKGAPPGTYPSMSDPQQRDFRQSGNSDRISRRRSCPCTASTNTWVNHISQLFRGWDVWREISYYNGYQSTCGINMSSWRGSECSEGSSSSESVVSLFHFVHWMPSCFRGGVCLLLVWFGLFGFLFCFFCFCRGHPVFCISPVL